MAQAPVVRGRALGRGALGRVAGVLFVAVGATACGGDADGAAPSVDDASGAELATNAGATTPAATAPGIEEPGARDSAASDDGASPEPAPSAIDPDALPVRLTGHEIRVDALDSDVDAKVFVAPVFVAQSALGTTLELVEATERVCVRGQLAPVPGDDFANYWGAEVGLMLAPNPLEETPSDEALSTPGFRFTLTGTLPPMLRFRVGAAGEVPVYSQYCEHVALEAGTPIAIGLDALRDECWLEGGGPFPASTGATLISWQIPASPEIAATPFDFCIEGIAPLP